MKKLIVFTFLIALSWRASAQYVNIPDANFRNVLINSYGMSSCFIGTMLDTTCSSVISLTALDVFNKGISNLDGISYFDNLTQLDCGFNTNLKRLPKLPPLIQSLKLWACKIDSLTDLPNSISFLDCRSNNLVKINSLPTSLNFLYCNSNKLDSLPPLPPLLAELECSFNKLTKLPSLPSIVLHQISCSANNLSTLPSLPATLKLLRCTSNQLVKLPALPANLIELYCDLNKLDSIPLISPSLVNFSFANNKVTNFPALPIGLRMLDCGNNLFSVLPPLPDSLQSLVCDGLNLTFLPTLSSKLRYIDCSNNQLNSIPAWPPNLSTFNCSYNQIDSLPSPMPSKMGDLYCRNNRLKHLPEFPQYFGDIDCRNNQLVDLPRIPTYVMKLYLSDNPDLKCMPRMDIIEDFEYDNTGITCKPYFYDDWLGRSDIKFDMLPVCGPFNPGQCEFYYDLNGTVYEDKNANCSQDGNEFGVENLKVYLYNGNALEWQSTTNKQGRFQLKAGFGNFSIRIDTLVAPIKVKCPASGSNTVNITNSGVTYLGQDFGVQCKGGADAGVRAVKLISGIFRPSEHVILELEVGDIAYFYGLHCLNASGGSVKVVLSGPVHFISAAPGALNPLVNGDTLSYNIQDFSQVGYSDFKLILQIDTTAVMNATVCLDIAVINSFPDSNLGNNHLRRCFSVTNSYDPNDKAVFPKGAIDTLQNNLTYTIRFQNTGNAEAQHIYVLDTLDSDLDVSSFELLSFSHQPQLEIKGNIARFNFPHINLADSISDEVHSHGYIQYSIKPKQNLSPGTKINNTAFIYFDFNAGVKTNTVQNWIKLPKRISSGVGLSPRIPIKLIKN